LTHQQPTLQEKKKKARKKRIDAKKRGKEQGVDEQRELGN